MAMRRQSRTWVLFIALLAGAIVGSVIGEVLSDVAPILSRGFSIGLQPPFHLDLNVVSLTFGFNIRLNLAGAILVLLLVLMLGR
ncbi:MAG TPA: DUF4321 domain-containing protein [Clostridiales bacterium UBA9857]|jgi:hypothetical protein|nr:DUF4321 domain-containing protein [Clostridiales bacterium UBA9857]